MKFFSKIRPFFFFLFEKKRTAILCLHDLPSLFPKLRFIARSGSPFVIQSILIGWGCSGLQMVELRERENGVWGKERGVVQTE